MRRILIAGVTCFAVLFASLTVSAADAQKVVIKFATLLPKNSAARFVALSREIKRCTNDAVNLKIYYGGVQGDEHDVIRKIRYKQLHGGSFTGHGLGKIVPAVRITELPYLFRNYDEVTYVRERLEPDMEKRFLDHGYVVLGWYETGFAYVFSKVPIADVETARRQKWWMWAGDPLQKANFDAMGISPVALSLTDVLTSLSTKLIDAAATTPFGAVAFRWYTRFHYMGEYPIANGVVGLIVSKNIWRDISAENQKRILSASHEIFAGMVEERRSSNDRSIEVLKNAGITVVPHDMNSPAMKYIVGASEKAREALVGELYERELLDKTLALLADYRKSHPESAVPKIH